MIESSRFNPFSSIRRVFLVLVISNCFIQLTISGARTRNRNTIPNGQHVHQEITRVISITSNNLHEKNKIMNKAKSSLKNSSKTNRSLHRKILKVKPNKDIHSHKLTYSLEDTGNNSTEINKDKEISRMSLKHDNIIPDSIENEKYAIHESHVNSNIFYKSITSAKQTKSPIAIKNYTSNPTSVVITKKTKNPTNKPFQIINFNNHSNRLPTINPTSKWTKNKISTPSESSNKFILKRKKTLTASPSFILSKRLKLDYYYDKTWSPTVSQVVNLSFTPISSSPSITSRVISSIPSFKSSVLPSKGQSSSRSIVPSVVPVLFPLQYLSTVPSIYRTLSPTNDSYSLISLNLKSVSSYYPTSLHIYGSSHDISLSPIIKNFTPSPTLPLTTEPTLSNPSVLLSTKISSQKPSSFLFSTQNQTTSLIYVSSFFRVQIRLVPAVEMGKNNTLVLQSTLDTWLQSGLDMTIPPYQNVTTKIKSQNILKVNRKLEKKIPNLNQRKPGNIVISYSLLLDIATTAYFVPTFSIQTEKEAKFSSVIMNMFRTPINTEELVHNIQDISQKYPYFSNVTNVNLYTEMNMNTKAENMEGETQNVVAIVAGTLCGFAMVFFCIVVYSMLIKKKRSLILNGSKNLKMISSKDLGLGGKLSARKGYHQKLKSFVSMSDWDDDITDGGKSNRTYQTLEHLYKQEKETMSSMSFGGVSVEDGVDRNYNGQSHQPGTIAKKKPFFQQQNSSPIERNELFSPKTSESYSSDSTLPLSPDVTKRKKELNNNNVSFQPFRNDEDTIEGFSIDTPGSTLSFLTDLTSNGGNMSNTIEEISPSKVPNRSVPSLKGEMSTFMRKYLSNSNMKGNSSLRSTLPQSNISAPYCYECIAPPGKLGIVIDTIYKCPVVYEVKNDSPLINELHPGDYIIAIDDTDTSELSASTVTKIMSQRKESQRKITFYSKVKDFQN